MKFKLISKKLFINIIVTLVLLASILLAFSSSFYMQQLSNKSKVNSATVIKPDKNIIRSPKIDEYISNIAPDNLIEEINIKKEVTSILTSAENRFQSQIFDFKSGEKLTINDLIKKDFKEDFANKINELLYLKYPTFIADVISKNDYTNVYFLIYI